MYGEVNRVMDAIQDMDRRIAGLDAEKRASLEDRATLDFDEWFTMGDWATRAQMAGIITIDEAMTLYAIHGEAPGTFEGSTLAERVTYMRTMVEIGPRVMGAVA